MSLLILCFQNFCVILYIQYISMCSQVLVYMNFVNYHNFLVLSFFLLKVKL